MVSLPRGTTSSLTLFACLALLLSGCADAPASSDGPEDGLLEANNSDTTGAISGVVVDEAVRPIEGATVTLTATQASTTTDVEGRFVFSDLEPGTYFLTAVAPRHLEAQTSIEVVAEQTSTARFSLLGDGLPDPYHQTQHFQGLITFHATVAWAQAEWMLDTYAGITTPACEQCVFTFSSPEIPTGHLFEATWEPNLEDPRGPYELYWSYAVPDPYQELFGYAPAPIYRTWEAAPFEETGEYKVMLLGDYDAVHLDQEFEIFLTQWFNKPVPDGWSILNGDQ